MAKTCIEYERIGDYLFIKSIAKTVGLVSLVKRVEDEGYSLIYRGLVPKVFFFKQREGRFRGVRRYVFKKGRVEVYEKIGKKVKAYTKKLKGYLDPYSASLKLYSCVLGKERGILKLFYGGRAYQMPYKVLGKRWIILGDKLYKTYVVEVKVNIKTESFLKPRGAWKLYLDQRFLYPIKMEVEFNVGSVVAVLDEVKGDRETLLDYLLY